MRLSASFLAVICILLCTVTVIGQGAAPPVAPEPPATDTAAPNIPGVVAGGAKVQAIRGDFNGTEGPVHLPDGSIIFTESGGKRLTKIDKDDKVSTFLDNVTASGLGFDGSGRLIAAISAADNEGVRIVYPRGSEKVLADKTSTGGLHRANDVSIDRNGGIYFTILDAQTVMCIRPDGKITKAAEGITRPNGIVLSPDEKVLYVNDARGEYVLAYDVQPDGTLANRRNFAKYDRTDPLTEGPFKLTSGADGLIVDNDGRLYVTGLNVVVYSAKGGHLGTIPVSRRPQNLAFGGSDNKTLYIVGRGAAYKVQMLAEGLKSRPR